MKHTNLEKARGVAKNFLYVDIAETRVPFVASHPFTNSWFAVLPGEGIVDLHEPEMAKKWRERKASVIEGSSLRDIFLMLNPAYILNFLKFVADDLSAEDLGKVLGGHWQNIEYTSFDRSMTGKQLLALFKKADKEHLMNEEERKVFSLLPETVTVYRGVTSHNRRITKAVSWTTDKEVARWFANRFDTGTGEVWTITVPKERILCAFEGREKELIVDLYGYKEQMTVEKA